MALINPLRIAVSGMFFFSALAFAQGNITEITRLESETNNYRHAGDVSYVSKNPSRENVIAELERKVRDQGGQYYRITRLEQESNKTWDVRAEIYTQTTK